MDLHASNVKTGPGGTNGFADFTAAPPAKRSARGPAKIAILAVVGLSAVVYGAHRGHVYWVSESTDNAQVEAPIVRVQPKVSGFVERILVEENGAVGAGDTLLVLDDQDKRVQVKAAEAALASARYASREGSGSADISLARTQGAVARANVESAKAEYERALKEAKRSRILARKDIITATQLDAADANLRRARAAWKAAADQVRGSDFGVENAKAHARSADARVLAAEAGLEAARLQLAYTVIRAPRSGIIAKKSVEVGQLVSAGQSLMALVDAESTWVVANFKETQISGIAMGQKATIAVDAYPGRVFQGVVRSIQPATGSRFALLPQDMASANFTRVVQRIPVRIGLVGEMAVRDRLRPGMSADVRVITR